MVRVLLPTVQPPKQKRNGTHEQSGRLLLFWTTAVGLCGVAQIADNQSIGQTGIVQAAERRWWSDGLSAYALYIAAV